MSECIGQLLKQATATLVDSPSSRLDAEVLLAWVLGRDRSYLFSHPEAVLSEQQSNAYSNLLARRAAGEPVAYLCGSRGFWTLELTVTPAVLIPRPETELLVELALELGRGISERQPGKPVAVADLGTGSGAIALALASEHRQWQVYATDRSVQALAVAQTNAARLQLEQVHFAQGDWCDALPAGVCFDMIISNPPYIAGDDPHLGQGDLRFEPRSALVADARGLADLEAICQQSRSCLGEGGFLLLEHGYEQGHEVRALLASRGFAEVHSRRDLAGHERVTLGRLLPSGEISDA